MFLYIKYLRISRPTKNTKKSNTAVSAAAGKVRSSPQTESREERTPG
jgi:hypothetical protein